MSSLIDSIDMNNFDLVLGLKGAPTVQQPNYFPYDLSCVPFAKQSAEKNIQSHNDLPLQHERMRNIVIGGFCEGETEFYEVFLNKDTTVPGSITSKSLNKDYGKSNADLAKIGITHAEDIKSFLIDNKYILVYTMSMYNVYNMIKDEWMVGGFWTGNGIMSSMRASIANEKI